MSLIEPSATPADSVPVTDAPPAEPAGDVDPFDTGADSFPRSYVEKLRNEAADYRTKYAPYRDTFGDVDPTVQEYLLDLNRTLIQDPKAAVAELRDLLKQLDPDSAEGQAVQATLDEIPDDKPLTLKEFRELQAKEQAAEAEKQGIEQIKATAKSLDPSYDAATDEYGDLASLLFIASHKTGGDLQKAHELRAERFNSAVEAEVEKRIAEIKSGARKWAPVQATGTSPAEEPDTPKTFADARKRANARMERIFSGS